MGRALEMDCVAPVLDFIKQDINRGTVPLVGLIGPR